MGYLVVSMQGTVGDVTTRTVGNGNTVARGKFNIILNNRSTGDEYTKTVNVSAWDDMAELLASVPSDVEIKVKGSLRISGYDKKCEKCGEEYKAYWTEIVISDIDV